MADEDFWDVWARAVGRILSDRWGIAPPEEPLDVPADPRFGEAVCNAPLRLARAARRPPLVIAEELAEALRREGLPFLERVEVAGHGFVNLTAAPAAFQAECRRILQEGPAYGRSTLGRGRRVLVEHCSANPTGPLHVAHGRQAAVGDSLANILEFAGYRVSREFYVNDTGNQIEMLGKSILWRLSGNPEPPEENCYRGDYIRTLAEELRAAGGGNDLEQAKHLGKERLLDEIRRDLETFRVRYDTWFSQETLEKSGRVEALVESLRKSGLTYEKDGALWLRAKDLGDTDDKVLIKSDGTYAYRTPDLAYHQDKFGRGFDIVIDLWGPDHHAHIATMKAGLKGLGFELVPPARAGEGRPAFEVLIVQHCRLLEGGREVKMSKRSASYVTLRELMEEVGVDAARFFFVMRKTQSHMDFDLDVARQRSLDNPVFYAQYAHARIASIWRKGMEEGKIDPAELKDGQWRGEFDPAKSGPEEIELLRAARGFRRRVELAARDLEPAILADYLRELSGAYQRYYEGGNRDPSKRVLADEEGLRRARLATTAAVQQVLRNGFRLLGLSAPEQM